MGCSGFHIETPPVLADPRLQALFDYWVALGRAAGGLPAVQALDPLRLPKLLANLWILEVAPDTIARVDRREEAHLVEPVVHRHAQPRRG